jgi:hypothetical protein
MKIWMIMTTGLALMLTLQPAYSETEKQSADDRGRYEGIAASENAVWVIDTRTGRVRKCTQEFSDQTPNCSGFSK